MTINFGNTISLPDVDVILDLTIWYIIHHSCCGLFSSILWGSAWWKHDDSFVALLYVTNFFLLWLFVSFFKGNISSYNVLLPWICLVKRLFDYCREKSNQPHFEHRTTIKSGKKLVIRTLYFFPHIWQYFTEKISMHGEDWGIRLIRICFRSKLESTALSWSSLIWDTSVLWTHSRECFIYGGLLFHFVSKVFFLNKMLQTVAVSTHHIYIVCSHTRDAECDKDAI